MSEGEFAVHKCLVRSVSKPCNDSKALSESVRQKTALLVSVVDLAAVVEQFP